MLGEFLGLDNVYLTIVFLDRIMSPLGTDVAPMSTEQSVLMTTRWTHRLVQSVTAPSELGCSTCLSLVFTCLAIGRSNEKSRLVSPASSFSEKNISSCPL